MIGPGSALPRQGDGTAAPLPDADLESAASWNQVERDPNPRATAFYMMSELSAVGHYECYGIMLGLVERLRQLNSQCQPAVKSAPETPPRQSGRSSSSNHMLMKMNRAARQHLDFLLTRPRQTACLTRLLKSTPPTW
jgi:hypothetical protein